MIPGAVHRSPDIYITAEENPEKNSATSQSMKVVRPVIASNGVPYLQVKSVGSHSISGREIKRKDRRGLKDYQRTSQQTISITN